VTAAMQSQPGVRDLDKRALLLHNCFVTKDVPANAVVVGARGAYRHRLITRTPKRTLVRQGRAGFRSMWQQISRRHNTPISAFKDVELHLMREHDTA
jgi:hypothetical protein